MEDQNNDQTNEQTKTKNQKELEAEVYLKFYVKAEEAYQRLSICQQCDKYMAMAKICGICKCFMPLKTKLKRAKCPIDKW